MLDTKEKNELAIELQKVEKAIQKSENLRQQALTKKEMYESQLKENEKELEELGITPEQAEKEIHKIESEILKNLEEIKKMIPFDLLKEYKMI